MGIDPNTKQAAGQGRVRHSARRGTPPVLGVLMLDTAFPRWAGDMGCDEGLHAPALRRRVAGAVPAEVVTTAQALRESGWAARFAEAAQALQSEGATAITSSCGFLVLLQAALQRAVSVPLVSSSLCQLPALLQAHAQVGVLTIDSARLGPEHLLAAGVPAGRLADVWVEGVDPAGRFAGEILGNRPQRDPAAAEADVVAAALRLRARAPDLRQVVLECTNMPPHARAVQRASGLQPRWLRHDPALQDFFAPEAAA